MAFYAFDDAMDNALAVEKGNESEKWHFLDNNFERKLEKRDMAKALLAAWDAHDRKFHESPVQVDQARFKDFCEEISFQKRGKKNTTHTNAVD